MFTKRNSHLALTAFVASGILFSHNASADDNKSDVSQWLKDYRSVVIVENDILNAADLSFANTIRSILSDNGKTVTKEEMVKFVETLVATLEVREFENRSAGYKMTVESFPGIKRELTGAKLLGFERSDYSLVPTAVFNRLDLAPKSYADCGEYRIVYSFKKPAPDSSMVQRLFLNFEARVPNPKYKSPGNLTAKMIAEGCKNIAGFWANLPNESDPNRIGKELHKFFYKETPGGGERAMRPETLGSQSGQIRGNLQAAQCTPSGTCSKDNQKLWLLREWRVMPTPVKRIKFPPLQFRAETLKDNPLAELYQDVDDSGQEDSKLSELKRHFHLTFAYLYGPALIAPKNMPKAPNSLWIVNNLALNPLGHCNCFDKFNEFQNVMSGRSNDNINYNYNEYQSIKQIINNILMKKIPRTHSLTEKQIILRAEAVSCGGCHKFVAGRHIGKLNNNEIQWPDTNERFVHISEINNKHIDRLSVGLKNKYLPYRKFNLEQFINRQTLIADKISESFTTFALRRMQLDQKLRQLSADFFNDNGNHELIREIDRFWADAFAQPGAFVPRRRTH